MQLLKERLQAEQKAALETAGQPLLSLSAVEVPDGILLAATSEDGRLAFRATIETELAASLLSSNTLLPVLAANLGSPASGSPASDSVRMLTAHEVSARLEKYRAPRRDSTIGRELLSGNDVLVIGPSASGKTMSALAMARTYQSRGWPVLWMDLVDPRVDEASLMCRLLATAEARKYLAIVDNLQANVGAAKKVCDLLMRLKQSSPEVFTILAVGWPSARSLGSTLLPSALPVSAAGDDVISELIRSITNAEEHATRISEIANGDVVVASVALDFFATHDAIPTGDEITTLVAERTNASNVGTGESRTLLYWFACLGIYEIDVSEDYCRHLPTEAFRELVSRSLIRLDGSSYRVGHRSLASLLAHYAWRNWNSTDAPFNVPSVVAVDYLRGVGDQQIRATLEKLDLVGLADGEAQEGSAFLARAWQSLTILTNFLVRQVNADPTWADNVASVVFSCESLAQLGQHEAWQLSAEYVRSRWKCHTDGSLPSYRGSPPADRDDFNEIFRTMDAEDQARRGMHWSGQLAGDVDLDRMHKTWVLGLLLGFEGSALQKDVQRLNALLDTARLCQEPSGAFYPERVPWVTARVVLGLCRAGGSYTASPVVRRACDWLRTSKPDGPYAYGAWESGTGTWNTTLMTTAMCLSALGAAGVPLHDQRVRAGLAYLREQRHEWAQESNEIDLANVLEAVLLIGGRWQDVALELGKLLSWTRNPKAWMDAGKLASDVHDESSKVAFIAAQLVSIVWATVKRELPSLLESASGLTQPIEPVDRDNLLDPYRSAALAEAIRRCEQLRAIVKENVVDRERNLRSGIGQGDSVKAALRVWRERAKVLQEITDELGGDGEPPSSVLSALDRLGRDVAGPAWQPFLENG
ncbi:hypothetical protein [Micromonospora chersina]|uniref:hypothetical protein n=1 Tax=Micromonospora chersina TaxID=47854 RepID=UPI003D93687C